MAAAFKVGVFGVILIGLCSLLFELLSRLVSLDPIVYFAAMAGVLVPMVMVMTGALARWASQDPWLFAGRPGRARFNVTGRRAPDRSRKRLLIFIDARGAAERRIPLRQALDIHRWPQRVWLPGDRRAARGLRGPVRHRRHTVRHRRAGGEVLRF